MSYINKGKDYTEKDRGFVSNPLVARGAGAIKQAMNGFMDTAKLLRTVTMKFNDKGRPDHVVEWVDIRCVITPSGKTRVRQSSGGNRSDTTYNVMWLSDEHTLKIDDVLRHRVFGEMKITEFDGLAPMGLTSASAVKTGAGIDLKDIKQK